MNLEELYDASAVEWFRILMSVIGVVGVAISTIAIFVVYWKSPRSMRKFRIHLLLYTFSNTIVELVILLLKPVVLPVYLIVYPQGLLAPMSETTVKILALFLLYSGLGMFVCFLNMIIERYFAMSNFNSTNIPFYRNPVYYEMFYLVAFVYICLILALFTFRYDLFISSDETSAIIRRFINGGSALLVLDQKFIMINVKTIFTILYFIATPVIIYFVTMAVFFGLCILKVNKPMEGFSQRTKSGHLMLFRCIVFQCLAICVLVFIPGLILTIAAFVGASPQMLLIPLVFLWLFPTVDNLITLLSIKPYRIFLVKMVFPRWKIDSTASLSSQSKMRVETIRH